jgi:hypothetical protein
MEERKKYRRRIDTAVVAVQINLDIDGFTYYKWGGIQQASSGDWLVDNGDDVYTVQNATFVETYRNLSHGLYAKVVQVWAQEANADGKIDTKEGATHYRLGDMLVFNDENGQDGYAMPRKKFLQLYEPCET